MYKEVDLMMHPSIKKLLSIKWKLYGRRRAIISNLGNLIHTFLATILIFAIPYQPYDKQFTPVKDHIWQIILAMLFIALTFFFWIKVSLIFPTVCTSELDPAISTEISKLIVVEVLRNNKRKIHSGTEYISL